MRTKLAIVIVWAAALPAATSAQQQVAVVGDLPYQPVTTYKVLRNGQEIGHHTLHFEHRGGQRIVKVDIDVDVKLFGLTAYRFSHQGREIWDGDQLQSLETKSDNNGRRYAVRAHHTAAGLVVEREQPADTNNAIAMFQGFGPPEIHREMLPAGILPTSLWNLRQVGQSALLNTHHGKVSSTTIVPTGREWVQIASGPVEATRYTYTGDIKMDQWFDDRGRWVRSAFKAFDRSLIEYILQE
jgi:hypothetical protein